MLNNEINKYTKMQIKVEINDFSSKTFIFWIFLCVRYFSYFCDVPNKIRPLNLDNGVTGTNSFLEKQPKNF